jgi:hypothetical protein
MLHSLDLRTRYLFTVDRLNIGMLLKIEHFSK